MSLHGRQLHSVGAIVDQIGPIAAVHWRHNRRRLDICPHTYSPIELFDATTHDRVAIRDISLRSEQLKANWKNGGEVDHPLEAVVNGEVVKFYSEAESILAKVPQRGISIVTKPDSTLFADTTLLPKAIREMAIALGMDGFTLDPARHGGMTEIEERN